MQEHEELGGLDNNMERFNFISWILCIMVILIPAMVLSILDTERDYTVPAYIVGFVLTIGYFSLPYWIYHSQVNHGVKTGCFAQLVFFGMTGLFGAVILIWIWDLVRFLQKRIMNPAVQIKYGVNTSGLLRR